MKNRFLRLSNKKQSSIGFNRQRNVGENNSTTETKVIKEFQKDNLRNDSYNFEDKKNLRNQLRTIVLPKYLDLIQIHFFTVFNYDLQKKFTTLYGLSPVGYQDFNKTVVFQIENEELFKNFISHLWEVINSPENTGYDNKPYNLMALIYKFFYFSSENRIFTISDDSILISLITTHLNDVYLPQKENIFQLLEGMELEYNYSSNSPDIIEIKNINALTIKKIADNFDIVKSIISSRTERIRPGIIGPIRDYGFEIDTENNLPIVGVIDTGINKIEPFRDILLEDNYNHTEYAATWDEVGHGTMVAGLIVLGEEFYLETKKKYSAKAKILNIKALHFNNDDLNIPKLIDDIKDARNRFGIKIFNMSLVIPNAKKYNSTYSQFAYELDKLAYEEDILIFLSVGNFDADSLHELKGAYNHSDHDYPKFFYNLSSASDSHCCEDTNICIPSESLNNISIGATAGNFNFFDNSDITPLNIYPAYYTRKFHLDYNQKINSTKIAQKNKNLNKPDFIFEGGDLFQADAGIEILRSPLVDRDKYFGRTSGTSLSTPLLTSYAAEVLNIYPTLKSQTIKAILINSANYIEHKKLNHFKDEPESLLKSLIGFGRPEKNKLLYTNNDSILYVIEENIKVHEIIKIPINIPSRFITNGHKIQFDIALAYSFMPIKDNHLDYLPLHISFNIVKNLDISVLTKNQEDYGIKSQFSWSEDHFGIDNRLFSNAQKMQYRLQPRDIVDNNGMIALAVRCLAKKGHENMIKIEHPFSIAVRITELPKNQNISGNLYSEITNQNNSLDLPSNVMDMEVEGEDLNLG